MKEIDTLLGNFGLTNYEKQIILNLYLHGPSKADDLAKRLDMRPSRVYEALDSLFSKNFIEISDSRPRIYKAKHPQEGIEHYIQTTKSEFNERMSTINNNSASLLDLLEPMYLKSHSDILPGELISQFSSLVEAEAYTQNLIKSAKKEILIFSHVFNWFDLVKDDLKQAIDRGCDVKVLIQTLADTDNKLGGMSDIGVKVKKIPLRSIMSRGTIVDGEFLLFVIWASEEDTEGVKRRIYRPQYSTNKGVVDVFAGNFNYLWEMN
ncbi:MAG: TrmB family transcriptional regulator [Candidatus Heimdallarchaeota archaeon]